MIKTEIQDKSTICVHDEENEILVLLVENGHINIVCHRMSGLSPNTAHMISMAFDTASTIAQEQRDKYDERGQ